MFDKALKELKGNVKVVDNVISNNHFKSFIKYENKPKKVQSQLTNMLVHDLETLNTDIAVLYAICICRLSKISGNYNQDITQRDYEKCRKDCIVFRGTESFNKMLEDVLQFKKEVKKDNIKNFKYNLYLLLKKDQDLVVILF